MIDAAIGLFAVGALILCPAIVAVILHGVGVLPTPDPRDATDYDSDDEEDL